MDIDQLEFYKNEIKTVTYKLFLTNEQFNPDSATISIFDNNNSLALSGDCTVSNNNISFTLNTDVTANTGYYTGIYKINKDEEVHYKKIDIDVRDI